MTQSGPTGGPQPSPRFPKKRLIEIVQTISGVQVVWTTFKRGLQGLRPGTERAWILAGLQSYVSVGVDELRLIYDPTLDKNLAMQCGQRQFTLVLRAQSLDSSIEAIDLLERVRFRFRTQTARVLMVPILALRDFGPLTSLPDSTYSLGSGVERDLLEATLDVKMSCVLAGDPEDPNEGEYIETASAEAPGANLRP